jgi:hypothetical protein
MVSFILSAGPSPTNRLAAGSLAGDAFACDAFACDAVETAIDASAAGPGPSLYDRIITAHAGSRKGRARALAMAHRRRFHLPDIGLACAWPRRRCV